ncbi:MAG: pentapeptide repeat-containing protein [Jatrophihabitantaceae bacterium]
MTLRVENPIEPQVQRVAILRRLAAFVQDRGPVSNTDTLTYCTKKHPLHYPTDVELALQAIGGRLSQDISQTIDLSGANLAYASIQRMDFRNVRFDDAVICRAYLNGSRFDGATFRGTILRFSVMQDASGISGDQLLNAYSLCGLVLPIQLSNSPPLLKKIALEPDYPTVRCKTS